CKADLQTSKQHCGRCNHDCGGGDCMGGKCQAVQLGTVSGAPLRYILVSATHVFVSPLINFTTETGGLWRVAKTGGTPDQYVNIRYAEDMVAFGDKLYFVSEDDPSPGATG